MLNDFRQFYMIQWRKSCLKQFFFFFFLHGRNAKASTSTQSEYTVYIICSRTWCHSAMHNSLYIREIKWVLKLQSLIPNANRLNIWQINNLSHRLKDNLSTTNTPNCGSCCEIVTGSNVINVLKGGGLWRLCLPGAKAFLLVTDNRRPWLNSPFCVITQHRKFEFGHHHQRQSNKISNAQELIMQLSQTLSSAISQIQKMHTKIGEKFVDLPAIRRPMTEGSSS